MHYRNGAVDWGGTAEPVTECSTHPDAPTGLTVLPGICNATDRMSVVVENESALPITVTDTDVIAVGVSEDDVPSLESCRVVCEKQASFAQSLDWEGGGKDEIREVKSPRPDRAIVVLVNKVPRFTSCTPAELGEPWKSRDLRTRLTTLTYEEGDMEYVVEDKDNGEGIEEWIKTRPWCGQTAFSFDISPTQNTEQGAADQGAEYFYVGDDDDENSRNKAKRKGRRRAKRKEGSVPGQDSGRSTAGFPDLHPEEGPMPGQDSGRSTAGFPDLHPEEAATGQDSGRSTAGFPDFRSEEQYPKPTERASTCSAILVYFANGVIALAGKRAARAIIRLGGV